MQLVPSMLGNEYPLTRCVNRKALTVAYPGGESFAWSERLVGLISVIAPGSPAGLKFRAGVRAGRLERSILQLAGVGRRAYIDINGPVSGDSKWMHGVVAAQR